MIIMSWNKNNTKIMNRIDVISHLIAEHSPDIFSIQKLNLTDDIDLDQIKIPNYKLEIDQLLQQKTGRARTAIYIKDTIKYKRRLDLETPWEPVIWLTIYPEGAAKFNYQNMYRQWQGLGQGLPAGTTDSIPDQKVRFKKITEKWKIALGESETISTSDTNIILDCDYNNLTTLSTHDRQHYPLYRILKEDIFNSNVAPIKTKPTKSHIRKRTHG